jgi:hypothetical protein
VLGGVLSVVAIVIPGATLALYAEAAYNVVLDTDPNWGFAAFVLALGLAPVAAGYLSWSAFRRAGWTRGGAWGMSMVWGVGIAIPALIIRVLLGTPF